MKSRACGSKPREIPTPVDGRGVKGDSATRFLHGIEVLHLSGKQRTSDSLFGYIWRLDMELGFGRPRSEFGNPWGTSIVERKITNFKNLLTCDTRVNQI